MVHELQLIFLLSCGTSSRKHSWNAWTKNYIYVSAAKLSVQLWYCWARAFITVDEFEILLRVFQRLANATEDHRCDEGDSWMLDTILSGLTAQVQKQHIWCSDFWLSKRVFVVLLNAFVWISEVVISVNKQPLNSLSLKPFLNIVYVELSTNHTYLHKLFSFFYCSICWVQAYHPASLLEMRKDRVQAVRHQCLLFFQFRYCNALFRCAGKFIIPLT